MKRKSNSKQTMETIKRFGMLTVGAFIYALAIALFLNPLQLAPGGLSGISIIINSFTGFSTGALFFLLNVPLMILALIKFGSKFFFGTGYVVISSSLMTDAIILLAKGKPLITSNLLLAGFSGGTLLALGIGIVFRAGATTGGTDILVKLLRRKYGQINTGTIFFAVDFVVIAASAIAFHNIEIALYAVITIFVESCVLDLVLYGLDKGKLVYVISSQNESISKRILYELDSGVTTVNGIGAYSGDERTIILCAIKNHSFPKLRKIVKEEDSGAFLIVSNTTEVFGNGYKPIDKEDL